jgi:hypothetical protein
MMTKYLNMALILALVVAAAVVNHYTPSDAQRVAAQIPASTSTVDLPN